jgi:hypothetical protein
MLSKPVITGMRVIVAIGQAKAAFIAGLLEGRHVRVGPKQFNAMDLHSEQTA